MIAAPAAPTTAIALLADLHPTTRRPDRIHAVLAWTDVGDRHYQPLPEPVSTTACRDLIAPTPGPDGSRSAVQLELDIDGPPVGVSSAGTTWRTWSLPSIPPSLRHLDLGAATRALATQLGGDGP